MTLALAPPWSAPESEPTAAATAAYMWAWVEATSRAAKVEALKECSACSTSAVSMARTPSASGTLPGQQVDEVGGVGELRGRGQRRQAAADAVPGGHHRGELGDQTRTADAQRGLAGLLAQIRVVVGQHGTAAWSTSMGWEAGGMVFSAARTPSGTARSAARSLAETVQFGGRRQPLVEEQVHDLFVAGPGEVLD